MAGEKKRRRGGTLGANLLEKTKKGGETLAVDKVKNVKSVAKGKRGNKKKVKPLTKETMSDRRREGPAQPGKKRKHCRVNTAPRAGGVPNSNG